MIEIAGGIVLAVIALMALAYLVDYVQRVADRISVRRRYANYKTERQEKYAAELAKYSVMGYFTTDWEFASYIRGLGVVALKNDDGWVDRANNRLVLKYCSFKLNQINVGDFIALQHNLDNYMVRFVRVTEIETNRIINDDLTRYKYEDVNAMEVLDSKKKQVYNS